MKVREDLIICWVAMGMNVKGMARMLGRSPKTVEWHLAVIKRKLGFNDPARLTHYALTNQLANLNETA
jgi:DNA-binding NarL/FixJ family response regulator